MEENVFEKKHHRKRTQYILLVIIVVLGLGVFFVSGNKDSQPNDAPAVEENRFIIEQGEGVSVIAKRLKQAGYIESEFWFKTYIVLKGLQTKLLAGTYALEQGWSLGKIANVLSTGPLSNERVITTIEGWEISDINDYLVTQSAVKGSEFLDIVFADSGIPQSLRQVFPVLADAPANASLEGYLFPNTYRIFKDATAKDIVNRMIGEFDVVMTGDMRADIASQEKTIFEIVTMASILEREVRTPEDKKKVADLFWRRLEAGIALQADSTVNYVTNKKTPGISLDDTKIDSPYNTYKYRGLPPGPISNPGIDSLEAAVYPTKNEYWYFLSASDGTTIFSKNFEEHKRNKVKYLR
ncbi:MAG TPA: endolytic transglycosylase MltG [Patescibacteria group bacterium]|nr:endolytic transglycosylase MltG [Patescibacteria group bacterium]